MFVGKGIDKSLFGLGVGFGDIPFNAAANITGTGDYVGKNITFVKAAPGDPNYVVYAFGQKYIAARKLTIGPGVTVMGHDATGGIINGAPGLTVGSGGTGGLGGVGDVVGVGGSGTTPARGGNAGAGGTSGTRAGGSAGQATATGLNNGWREACVLVSGHVINGGTVKVIGGGAGGGGGGGHVGPGNGGDGGGGGGVIIMAAPVIEIAGTIDMRGNPGAVGSGTQGGGGGGGGGGLLILIYGELIFTGSILLTGGAGGNGFTAGAIGGSGGSGGRSWQYSGDPETFVETIGSAGANGANG